jgi:tRNA dimethylallyltransferase
MIVGGTGLYLRALFDGLFTEPALDARRRGALAGYLAMIDTEELRRWVQSLDAERAYLGRTQLLRAIEIALLTGTTISALHRESAVGRRWTPRWLVVDPGAPLAVRNERRVDAMLAAGWLDEVRRLTGAVPEQAPAWNASGYGVMRRLASGELDLPSAREAIVIETRQYVKRQRTWFRHQLDAGRVTHVDPSSPGWDARVERWWAGEHEV